MSTHTLRLTDTIYRYLLEFGVRESEALARLRQETAAMPAAMMQIAPDQGQMMAMLVRVTGAMRCLEVGTFTGYSAMACAEALPAGGRLIALDISEEWTRIARRHWTEAGLGDRIELRLGPAEQSMRDLLKTGSAGQFDFIFIDADKPGYATYYELALELARPGGLIAVDNVLWSGAVADDNDHAADTKALRAFNAARLSDQRIDLTMVPIGDGLTLARKRL